MTTATAEEVNGAAINLTGSDPRLISICQQLLNDAKSGRLRGIAFVGMIGNNFAHGHLLPNESLILAVTHYKLDRLKDDLREIDRQNEKNVRPSAIIPARFGG